MDITGSQQRQALVEWGQRLVDLIGPRDPEAQAGICRALEQLHEGRFVLTVLGKAKRGKSTLVNALLGRRDDQVAPIDKLPASNVISRFVWAEEPKATVFFRARETAGPAMKEVIPYARIRDFVTEEANPGNNKNVEVVEIAGPFAGFDRDLVLIDTPGAGSIHEYHDALLHAFIPQSDAVVFLVTARMPIDQDELDLLRQVRAADIRRVLFAISKVDRTSDGDIEEAVAHNRALLQEAGVTVEQIHRISALQAFQGDLAKSGVEALAREIQQLLATEKSQVLRARFLARVTELVGPVAKGVAFEVSAIGKSAAELDQQRRELEASRTSLKQNAGHAERKFLNRWNAALNRFTGALTVTRDEVKASILHAVQESSTVAIGRLAKELPTLITQQSDDALRPHAVRLERELQEACQELQAEYPMLSVQAGTVAMGRAGNRTLLVGAAGAVAAAAAGAGLITAAQAAAAASVAYVTAPSIVGAILMDLIGTSAGFVTTTAVPVAAPVWVALAGPIGWTIAGAGALALPFAWAMGKAKQRRQLEEQAPDQVDRLFAFLLDERVPQLRRSAETIAEEFNLRLEREIGQAEAALRRVASQPQDEHSREQLRKLDNDLRDLMSARGVQLA